jgi:hypothetical protein
MGCACVEEDTDDCQIEFSPSAGSAIGPFGLVGDISPAVVVVGDEVPPARMKRHLERRVGLARRFQHQLDHAVHALEMDTEIWQLVLKTDR